MYFRQTIIASHMQLLRILALCVLILSSSGCFSFFSPFLHLPRKPLRAGSTEVAASVSTIPLSGGWTSWASEGGEMIVRHGLTHKLTLQGRAWARFDAMQSGHVDGLSLEAIVLLSNPAENLRWAIVPRGLLLTDSLSVHGWAVGGSLVGWTGPAFGFDPYFGVGFLSGAQEVSYYGGPRYIYQGVALLTYLGFSYDFWPSLHLQGEMAFVLMTNSYDELWRARAEPSVTLAYQF